MRKRWWMMFNLATLFALPVTPPLQLVTEVITRFFLFLFCWLKAGMPKQL
jgi:hypothetical protein